MDYQDDMQINGGSCELYSWFVCDVVEEEQQCETLFTRTMIYRLYQIFGRGICWQHFLILSNLYISFLLQIREKELKLQ